MDVIELGMSVDIPFGAGNRQITGYVVGLGDKAAYPVEKIKYITGITEGKVTAVSRMLKLAAWLKHNYGCTMNQAIKTVIPVKDKVKQKEKHSVNLIIDAAQAQKYLDTFAKKNAKARYRLLEALIKEPVIDESIIKSKLNITAQTVKAFEDMGIAEVRSEDMYRNPVRNVTGERKRIELNEQQKNAVDTIIADYDNGDYKTYLLHGVTGSGKTEVYLETIEHVLNHGRQAIVLIPEIALTFQTVQRFYHRFGDKVSIMNSRMSKGERYDQFLRAQRGDISVMIGPRSALFTPFSNIGVIIIDEEHESSYKSETIPKYHARETAIFRAGLHHARVILGSATPSVESYYKALHGEYRLHTLSFRASGAVAQAEEIETATLRMNTLGELIDEMTENVKQLAVTSDKMDQSRERAEKIITELSESNVDTVDAASRMNRQIHITNDAAVRIQKAIQIITSIADETNLLSLNASIEAARAGEQGKGFAVVANQIQTLAEQSGESAKEIEEITAELLQESTQAVSIMEEMQNIVGEEAEKLEETKQQFMNVSEGVTETRNETQNMRQKTKECAGVRQEMMDVISNLSAVSEENAASTQETTASMQVLNDTIATQADSAGNLSNLSKSMDQQLKFFEL